MSLIPCTECGTDISNKARVCPYCGYQSDNPSRPISEQDEYIEHPRFEFVFDYCVTKDFWLSNLRKPQNLNI